MSAECPSQSFVLDSLADVSLQPSSKVVHLIRHGQAFHNVAGAVDREAFKSYEYEDANLTAIGWQQAHALSEPLRLLNVELVVVSPLKRTLETAAGIFGIHHGGGGAVPLLMQAQEDMEGKRTSHPSVHAPDKPAIMALELCREIMGVNPCDKRSTRSFYAAHFPSIPMDAIETEEDTWWTPDHRETPEELAARGGRFLAWLCQRPERVIAVVSHSSFLRTTLEAYGRRDASGVVPPEICRYVHNGEMRSVVLTCQDGKVVAA